MSATPKSMHISSLTTFSPRQKEADVAVLGNKDRPQGHKFVLYGGAMGGGKSYFLRKIALKLLLKWAEEGHENVEVGIFCENYPALKDRQLSKIGVEFPEWIGSMHQDHKIFGKCFILDEAYGKGVIKFRNLDDPSKYQSAEFAAILVDELTKNKQDTFDDLRHRMRWPGISDCKFIGATNPGSVGHAWVKKLWLDGIFDENEQEKDDFMYIQALAEDNPHLDPNYLKSLDSLPNDKRRAYRDGDWDVFKGQYFSEFNRNIHSCEPFPIPSEWKKFIMGDYGYAAPSAVYWGAMSPEGRLFIYRELYVREHTFSQLAQAIVELTPPSEKITYWVFDPAIWARRGEVGGALSGAEIMSNRYMQISRKRLNIIRGNNDRINGWIETREWLKTYVVDNAVTSNLMIFNNCTNLIRTFPSLVYDENKAEDCDTHGEDHGPDAVRYGIMSRPIPTHTPEQVHDAWFNKKLRDSKKRSRLNLFG